MANPQISIPTGSGGLISYKEEEKSKFMLSPKQLVIFAAIILIVEIFLHYMI